MIHLFDDIARGVRGNGTDLSTNLSPVRTYDVSPVIHRWEWDIQSPTTSPVGTSEASWLYFNRPYRTQRDVCVGFPAMNYWANVRCPDGQGAASAMSGLDTNLLGQCHLG